MKLHCDFHSPDFSIYFLILVNNKSFWKNHLAQLIQRPITKNSGDSGFLLVCSYSYLFNRRAYTLIAGKVCLLTLIEAKRQTLPSIRVHARLLDR